MPQPGFSLTIPITKQDAEKRMVWGWLLVSKDERGEYVVDHDGDTITMDDIEKAAEGFMVDHRSGDVMHADRSGDWQMDDPDVVIVESFICTKDKLSAMGLSTEGAKEGWWIGGKVLKDDVWARVKSGELAAWSIGGTGQRIPLEDD